MDLLNQLKPAQLLILTTVVAGVTELYNRIISKDWKVVGKIVVAVVTGTAICMSFGLDFVLSLALAFAPSGALTLVGSIGNKSEATPRTVTGKTLE